LIEGIHIQEVNIKNLSLKELYIKWDEKLILQVDKVLIFKNQTHKESKESIYNSLSKLTYIYDMFKIIDIKYLRYKDIEATIKYSDKQDGFFNIKSAFFNTNGYIFLDDNNININIESFYYKNLDTSLNGYILFDKSNKTIVSDLNINITKQADFKLNITLENQKLYYKAFFNKPIKDTAKILNMLNLPKPVRYWCIDAVSYNEIIVKKLDGFIDLKNPKSSLKNLHVIANATNLKYKYNKNIEPVFTTYTQLEFKKGVLYIRPQNPTTYGYYLEKSYLKIDFTKENELLTLYLKFDNAKLDENILHILSTYHIDVPLLQLQGTTKTDLVIKVSLRKIKVNAKGTFYTKKGKFKYLGMDIDVKNVKVELENSHIVVKQMEASLDDIIKAKVNLNLQLSKKTGILEFFVNKLDLKKANIKLDSNVKVTYFINKKGLDTIDIPKTSFLYKNKKKINIEAIKIPFDFKNLSMNIPITKINFDDKIISYISGNYDIKTKKSDIDIDIIKLNYDNLSLAQSNIYLKLTTSKKSINIDTNSPLRFYTNNNYEISLNNLHVNILNNKLYAPKISLDVKNFVKSKFDIVYNLDKNNGEILLNLLEIKKKSTGAIFKSYKNLKFEISNKKDITISSKELATSIKFSSKGVKLSLVSLRKLVPYSKLLQLLSVKDGYLYIDKDLYINAYMLVNNQLFIKNDNFISKFNIEGHIEKNKSIFTINNDDAVISISDYIELKGKNLGLNIIRMEKLLEKTLKDKKGTSNLHLNVELTNSYLYISKNRTIISDKISLQILNGETTAQLTHKQGHAGFRYKDNNFYLYGSNFGDEFMDKLFFQSEFKGGSLNFNIIGTFDDYSGIFEITDTTILDYKILNNILAFIDTVPALATFSMPKYSTEGLKVSKAYASFHFKNNIFDFDNINLKSDNVEIIGKAKASYKYNFIDLVVQLKTKIADKISKIPMVGYILFDGKSLSTTLKIEGKLTNPKVSTMVAKDIVVAPLNIIKRTILYPMHLFGLDEQKQPKK